MTPPTPAMSVARAALALLALCSAARADLRALFDFSAEQPEDFSGHGVELTVNGAQWDPIGFFVFDGVDDYLRVELDINPSQIAMPRMTIGAFVRPDALTGIHTILSADDSGCDRGLAIDQRPGDTHRWTAFSGTCPPVGGPPASTGGWTLLVAVYDTTTSTVRFYVDGVETQVPGSPGNSFSFFDVGRNPTFGQYFSGAIDNLFVFEGVLDQAQIDAIQVGGPAAILATTPDDHERRQYEHDGFMPDPLPADVIAAPGLMATTHTPIEWAYVSAAAPRARRPNASPSVGGAAVPAGSSWTLPGFDDSRWERGSGGFGALGTRFERDAVTTEWTSRNLWLRTEIELSSADLTSVDGAPVAFWGRWEDRIDLWINGVPALEESPAPPRGPFGAIILGPVRGQDPQYRYLGVTAEAMAAWRVGTNTIAVRADSPGGGHYFDLGLVRNPFDGMPADGFHTSPAAAGFLDLIRRWAARTCIPATSFAVMIGDTVVSSYSVGYLDKQQTVPAPRDAYFRLGSVNKPISAALVNRLVELEWPNPVDGQPITLDTLYWPLMEELGITVAPTLTPDPRAQQITLGQMIRHTSGMGNFNWSLYRTLFGPDFGPIEIVRTQYGIPLEFDPCYPDGIDHPFCAGPAPVPLCNKYSSAANMLLRVMVDLLTTDLEGFLETEVVHAAAAGMKPLRMGRQPLDARDPSEPWYRTWRWEHGDTDQALPFIASAESICLFQKQRRLYWGQEMPDTLPCHSGYPAKVGRGAGTHTYTVQGVKPEGYRGFTFLSNEFGQTSFGGLYYDFIGIIEAVDAGSGW